MSSVAVPAPPSRVTPEEYLAFDRASEERWEYVNGEIRAMTGGSRKHALVTLNLAAALHAQLRGRPCESYASDMRVRVPSGNYTFPDVVVVCGAAELEENAPDTLLNPTLIVEVLSPSTTSYDRGDKWAMYRRIPSLRDYLVVAQDEPRVERYTRYGSDGLWLFSETEGIDAAVEMESVGCVLRLADVYERVL